VIVRKAAQQIKNVSQFYNLIANVYNCLLLCCANDATASYVVPVNVEQPVSCTATTSTTSTSPAGSTLPFPFNNSSSPDDPDSDLLG